MSQPTDPPVRLLVAFQQAFPEQFPAWIVRVPGRDVWVAAAPSHAAHYSLAAPQHESRTSFTLRSAKLQRTATQRPLPRWSRYPVGVILTLCYDGLDAGALNIVVLSEESPGPAYDYGLGMGLAALWFEIHTRDYTTDTLVEVVDRARRDYVGE